jgi:vitamin K-dependent gamma-carboxylase
MRFKRLLAQPVSAASLAVLRMAVGAVMALEAYSLCRPSPSTMGQIPLEVFYTRADSHLTFPYAGFQWLPLLPPHGIYVVVGLMALAGVTMALGLCYRLSAAMVFLTWGYLYAVESTRTYWMSYYYLELLVLFLLVWMPAARGYSLDAWLGRKRNPPVAVPYWTIFLLRGQLLITYFYAGVAKFNSDWLVQLEPVRYYLSKARAMTDFAPYLNPAHLDLLKRALLSDALAYFISYVGLMFDLSVGFLLLFRRTRIFGMILMLIFHATNHFILFDDIEWFPLVGMTTALIFLDPDWPERLWKWLRRPRFAKPDWGWFVAGGVLFPVVGAALGWKLRPARPLAGMKEPIRPGRFAAPLVVIWLVWQVLIPIRHYFISGDARFTWEGLSFSWRLKAEVYRSTPLTLTVEDPAIISSSEAGLPRIDWTRWLGERVIYRTITPDQIDWPHLPEIMVLLEQEIGERIIYNPCSGVATCRTEAESRGRVSQIWQDLYGRNPQTVHRTFSYPRVINAYVAALRAKGEAVEIPTDAEAARQMVAALLKKHGREGDGRMLPVLRRVTPFGMDADISPDVPFLVIDDETLYHPGATNPTRVDRRSWVNSACTRSPNGAGPAEVNVGQEPLVIYAVDITVETKDFLPQALIFDLQDHPEQPAAISWNYLQELSTSEAMHVSMQPFFLRRYARHVADLWQKDYGHRPLVHAATEVSLNGRPMQRLVDPKADLARVPVNWFGHNPWIRDLEVPQLQSDGLVPRKN